MAQSILQRNCVNTLISLESQDCTETDWWLMEQVSQVITVEGNMAGLLLGDDIEDNESESSVESLADDKVLNDASRIIASSQLSHEDDGEDEEFEFFGDSSLKYQICFMNNHF